MSYPYPPPYSTQVVLPPPRRASTAHVVIAWVLAVITLLYFLPWAIAATRSRRNVLAIALINFFLGWTLVGWVAALVMACLSDSPTPVVVNHVAYGHLPPPAYPGYAAPGTPAPPVQPGYSSPRALPSQPPAWQAPEPTTPLFGYGSADPSPNHPTQPLPPVPPLGEDRRT